MRVPKHVRTYYQVCLETWPDTSLNTNILPTVSQNMFEHKFGHGHTAKCVQTAVQTQQPECSFGHSGRNGHLDILNIWTFSLSHPDSVLRLFGHEFPKLDFKHFLNVYKVLSCRFTNSNDLFSLIYILNIQLMSWTLHKSNVTP
jgi:hypothetical protein